MAKANAKKRTASPIATLRRSYVLALLDGDSERADDLVERGLSNMRLSPEDLYLEVLMPAQRRLGELWQSGEISVAEEHRASQITLTQMDALRRVMKPKTKHGRRVVIATPSGDQHQIPCRVIADFLSRDGWTVDCIGPETPADELKKFIEQQRPDLLALSLTIPGAIDGLRECIKESRESMPQLPILLGGSAFTTNPELLDDLEHSGFARDVSSAITRARELVGLPSAEADLDMWLKFIGRRIQELRTSKGLRQQDLAEKAELDRAYLSTLEHGKQNVTIGAMVRLANALRVDLEDLIRGDRPRIS